jgi:hypothetical protein
VLVCALVWLTVGQMAALQLSDEATALLARVRATTAGIKNWRAEVVEVSQLSGGGMNVPQQEVRTRIAVQAPLKMSRKNSGADRTIMICNGTETFYSGDGITISRGDVRVTPQCDYPLSHFYPFENNPMAISIIGRDRVRLASGVRECVLLRVDWKRETLNGVNIYCVDPVSAVILRDAAEGTDARSGARLVKTTTFTEFEIDPVLPADTFEFPLPAK